MLTAPVPKIGNAPAYANASFAKGLAKRPEDRFATCTEFVDALEGRIKVAAAGGKTGRWLAFAAIAIALMGGVLWWLAGDRGTNEDKGTAGTTVGSVSHTDRGGSDVAVAEVVRLAAEKTATDQERLSAEKAVAEQKAEQERLAAERAALEKKKAEETAAQARKKLAEFEAKARAERDRLATYAALQDLRSRLTVRVNAAEALMRQISDYRGEQDGFESHLGSVDEAWARIEKRPESIVDPAHGTNVLRTVVDVEGVLARELEWLKANKGDRDNAKRIECEIDDLSGADLARLDVKMVASRTFDHGQELRNAGRTAFRRGEFAEAGKKFTMAKKAFLQAIGEAKASRVDAALAAAERFKAEGKWQMCLAEAEKALADDSDNAVARELKRVASMRLASTRNQAVENERGGAGSVISKTARLSSGAVIELVWCPPGRFSMGSPYGAGNERPVHQVSLTKGFWIGKYEVTQEQWESVMGGNPSYFKGDNRPVEQVSWEDCQKFCRKAGRGFRLPTEAEWEYACRAGTKGDYAGNLDEMAWYDQNGDTKTHSVGTKAANAWGIHDMHGNVREWCQDWHGGCYPRGGVADPTGVVSGVYRVFRGGGWDSYYGYCRSAHRNRHGPTFRDDTLGLRVACSARPHDLVRAR